MDVQSKTLTFEVTGIESMVIMFVALRDNFGVLDLTRTGKVALPRS